MPQSRNSTKCILLFKSFVAESEPFCVFYVSGLSSACGIK